VRASDLDVEPVSDALTGLTLDLIVCGSIGAVESVRFVRALRRLGATVTPWLTRGAKQFVTPTALGWAAAAPVRDGFAGDASHIATADACIIAPASAAMIAKIAGGMTDSPASALIASALGAGKPVLLVPNMHDSLADSPGVRENLAKIGQWLNLLEPRLEEGKRKFPDPAVLADECAHVINRKRRNSAARAALVTLGSTRGYVDDVRYFSNYSSGALGSLTAEELYRQGILTRVVAGSARVLPRVASQIVRITTNAELEAAGQAALAADAEAAVLAASVLDFVPAQRTSGKISSSVKDFRVDMIATPKIIAGINPRSGIKVGFKLESDLTTTSAQSWASKYIPGYGLSMMVLNALADVDETRHRAMIYSPDKPGQFAPSMKPDAIEGKSKVARFIAAHVIRGLTSQAATPKSSQSVPR